MLWHAGHLRAIWQGFRVRSRLSLSRQPHSPCIISPTGGSICPSPKRGLLNKRRKWQTASLSDPPFPWRGNPGVIVSTKYGFDCLNPLFVRVCLCVRASARVCVIVFARLTVYPFSFSSFIYSDVPTNLPKNKLFNHVDRVWNEDNLQSTTVWCGHVQESDTV